MKIAVLRKKRFFGVIAAAFCLLFVAASAMSLGNSVQANAAARKIPVYRVDAPEKVVSITFDAAWGADKTEGILDILDDFNAKATFFLVGFWVDKFSDMVKEIDARGHEIGSHSETHPHMPQLTVTQMQKEIETSCAKITALTGKKVDVFRPPFGDYNDALVTVCENKGIIPVQWDVDTLDWKGLSAEAIHERVVSKAKSGSIILFHNNSDNVLKALPLVLQTLSLKGFSFVPVGDMVLRENYFVDNNGEQHLKEAH